ncbi:hypothetical protein [Rhizorhabdus dicambivorans]|uniref:Uncharacterized protein n=1 Tax=Rhizorhabdus dicambivorans TaxID=1850238 RepID=A0A2A4FSI5_9SPHN|nr:hypothetical protein [Rhizorhabdus dicambivorans]ATE67347.1 hypothetical protein CMV14_14140 [Rhizorhabdus dicambivorans]PCE40652.1 hypothetical protein COO09_19485 [Rhizorhabdus dicambivorans]
MALFKHKPAADAAPFKERRVRGKVVAFSPEIVAEHVPSPAHALQQLLADRASTDGFIADAAERRRALFRFVGLTLLLWGGSAAALISAMVLAG